MDGIDHLDYVILSLFISFVTVVVYMCTCSVYCCFLVTREEKKEKQQHLRYSILLTMPSLSSRLNYASILLVLILSVFAETSNAQQRVRTARRRRLFSLRLDSREFVMQSFSTRPTSENKHATTVNKQFRQIFSRRVSPAKRTRARAHTETRIE